MTTTADAPPQLARVKTDLFIDEYWAPEPGQQVTLVGPNGCGKTTIGMKLLASTTAQHPFLRGVALVMKPSKGAKSQGRKATGDRTVANLTRTLGGKVIRDWPPPPLPWRTEPPFWVLWPPHTAEPEIDNTNHAVIFRKCLIDLYKKGDSVAFADEASGLSDQLDLDPALIQTLTRGRSMNASLILATQRPRFVPRAMFTEAKHFFLWRMADEGEYERLREISGGRLTRKQVVAILSKLGEHECLYLYPARNVACILI